MNYLVYLSLLVDRSMLVRVVPQVFLKVDLKNVEVVFINHIYIVGVSVGNDKAKGDKLKEVFEKIIIVVEDSNCWIVEVLRDVSTILNNQIYLIISPSNFSDGMRVKQN